MPNRICGGRTCAPCTSPPGIVPGCVAAAAVIRLLLPPAETRALLVLPSMHPILFVRSRAGWLTRFCAGVLRKAAARGAGSCTGAGPSSWPPSDPVMECAQHARDVGFGARVLEQAAGDRQCGSLTIGCRQSHHFPDIAISTLQGLIHVKKLNKTTRAGKVALMRFVTAFTQIIRFRSRFHRYV